MLVDRFGTAFKRPRVRISLLLTTVVVTILATSLVARAAAPGDTIKLDSTGSLASPPNSVVVNVSYSCQPSQFAFGSVNIDQSQTVGGASGSRQEVFGFGSFQPTCDDKTHKAVVVVSTGFFGGSFVPGSAGASAFVASGAVFANTQIELSIK